MKRFVVPMLADKQLLPAYVYTVGGMANQSPIDRQDGYAEFIWLQTVKGRGKLEMKGKSYILREGLGLLLYPETPHRYEAIETPWETSWVAFNGPAVRPLLERGKLRHSDVFELRNGLLLEHRLMEIFSAADVKNTDIGLKTSGKLYQFIIDLIDSISDKDRTRSSELLLDKVLAYMDQHRAEPFSLEEMAESLGMSHQYICRIFNKMMHTTPGAYLTQLRLQKAKEMLIGTSLSIAEVGRAAGFPAHSYFGLLFRQQENMSPSEYRRKYR